jgi:glycerophosphoryl diester phosphodiesterase
LFVMWLWFLFSMIGCAQVVAIAHRGEHLHHPENTMAAYAEAVRLGVDFFEVDVRTSADGKLVLSHDATVERCTNGKGAVSSLAFAQLRALDAGGGQRIPTFEEALQLAREGGRGVYVDWKEARAAGLEVRALNPRMKLMPEAESVTRAREIVERLRPPVIAFDARDFTAEIIAVAKRAGAKVYVDRMGETDGPAGWQAAIDSGADGIQTDRPGELVEYLRSHGYKKSP